MAGILKSILYMIVFIFVLNILTRVFKFILFFVTQRFKNEIKENDSFEKNDALKMLQCEKCKTYIIKSEAHIIDGKIFCKKNHDE